MTIPEQHHALERIPNATYRLQFGPHFTLHDARAIMPYLHALGVSDLYASPLFAARSGSTHGYDVTDYGSISPALGGDDAFTALSDALQGREMGLLLDMVPNHMGVGPENAWWVDVLENGQSSPYAAFFDIEWRPIKPELAGKVLLPILGDQYGVVLERGELRLEFADGAFSLCYNDYRLPLAPRTYAMALEVARDDIAALAEDDEARQEFESILTAIGYLPGRDEQDPERLAERRREKEVVKRRLAALDETSETVRVAINAALITLNGRPGDARSFDRLHELIDAQPYRLAFWRVAAEEINYRRFFDINDLAAVRVELPEVFEATHAFAMRLIAQRRVTGLRIDHSDGLWDPPGYFRQLQEAFATAEKDAKARRHDGGEREAAGRPSLYVVAEKILSEREPLPEDWAVAGTVGYDFLNAANGLFVPREAEGTLDVIYRRFICPEDPASVPPFHEQERRAKQLIMETALASEINALAHRLERINEKNRRYRDFTLQGMTRALIDLIASLPIYRTYICDADTVSERDRRFVQQAVRAARRRHPRTPRSLFTFIEETLLLRNLHEFREQDRLEVVNLVMRFQQITGPVMAKSVEDTAFYGYHRLVSLNEVGGSPDVFGMAPAAFHHQNDERRRRWPHAMLSSSTHDTKRSEDVRARINVLAELPAEWERAVSRWTAIAAPYRRMVDEAPAPDRNDEYLLYQTLVGGWEDGLSVEALSVDRLEADRSSRSTSDSQDEAADKHNTSTLNAQRPNVQRFQERIAAYMEKATKEAKIHTNWINPDDEYDAAVRGFVEGLLADDSPLFAELIPFARRVAFFGRFNSLAQTLLKLAAPGVPDIYQGSELWDLSLVDPDNRRPVDFAARAWLLDDLRARAETDRLGLARELLETCEDGRIKLFLIAETLAFRRRAPALFALGDYRPLDASGRHAEHVVAFARAHAGQELVAVVPRLVATLTDGQEVAPVGACWSETRLALPQGHFRNILTGAEVAGGDVHLADLLRTLPVALLARI
jgi:(1->4)-alpha-D-glucan 1-alpha-D-glucosylmutase